MRNTVIVTAKGRVNKIILLALLGYYKSQYEIHFREVPKTFWQIIPKFEGRLHNLNHEDINTIKILAEDTDGLTVSVI